MVTRAELANFSTEQLVEFVGAKLQDAVGDTATIMQELWPNKLTGATLLTLTDAEFRELIPPLGDRKSLKQLVDSYKGGISRDEVGSLHCMYIII